MPELPEVEHVVRALRLTTMGRRIVTAELRLRRIAPGITPATFKRKLSGSTIEDVSRRGKYILVKLNSARVLLAHLRMTGKFVCLSPEQALPPYSHVVFYLDDDRRLVFCDMRQFGRLRLVAAAKLSRTPELRLLAPEPLSDGFTVDYLAHKLSHSRRSLKQLLLDQTKILGLGNIYAAEALFRARVSPFASAASISRQRVVRLHHAICEVLNEALNCGSTLRIDLADGHGSYFGSDQRFWHVYEREGEPCISCGARIKRVVHGGRSTYFCPRCQRR